jgi:hypothetical protein
MVNHYVFWNFNDSLSKEEKTKAGLTIKEKLEAVGKLVPGVVSLEVRINELSSSNRDIALLSSFESVEALNSYQVHPEHINAGSYIKTVAVDRTCFDFEV